MVISDDNRFSNYGYIGFGFDPKTKDYKVVSLQRLCDD